MSRLRDGRDRKRQESEAKVRAAQRHKALLPIGWLTQGGKVKTVGCKSTLFQYGPLSPAQKKKLRKAFAMKKAGAIGWRPLTQAINNILGLSLASHESARRLAAEFELHDRTPKAARIT